MSTFREENRTLIYKVNISWVNMKSIEIIEPRRWIVMFFKVWTKAAVVALPIYMGLDIPFFYSKNQPLLSKIAMGRKFVAFLSFFLKALLFYWIRNDIEGLVDTWDSFFKEEFYPEEHKINRKNNIKQNNRLVLGSLYFAFLAACFYSLPSFFSKTKEIHHPSGMNMISKQRSPNFELIVMFDFFCGTLGLTSPAFDCILIVFLSYVKAKLNFLQDTLTHMINVFIIEDDGRFLVRRGDVGEETDVEVSGGETLNLKVFEDEALKLKGFKKGYYEETRPNSEEYKQKVREFEDKLRIWIRHHQQTIGFFDKLKKVYSTSATFELGYIVAYTALTALHLVQVKPGLDFFGIVLVALSNLMSLFLWCKIGGEVSEIHPFNEGFGRAWFLFPKKIQVALCIIIMRCNKRLTLYGISLYGINLATFFVIMKLTYQFFAFMVQITE